MRVSGVVKAFARVLVGSLIMVTGVVIAPALGAQFAHANSAAADSIPLKATVAVETALVAPEQEVLPVELALQNLTKNELKINSIGFFVDPDRVPSQSALLERLARAELPSTIGAADASLPSRALAAEERTSVTLEIPVPSLQLPEAGAAGVYVLYARLSLSGGGFVVTSVPIVWQGTGTDQRTPVHTVIPLVLPDSVDGMPTLGALADLTGPDGALTQRVNAAIDNGATLAIDPRIPTAVSAFGDAAPASATALLERITASGVTTFALQYADADLAAQAELGLPAPLEPVGFDFVSGEPVSEVPFSYTLNNVAWPSADTLSAQGVSFLRAAGFTTMVMSGDNVTPALPSAGTLDGVRVVALDSAVNTEASRAVEAETPGEQAQARSTVVALLALNNQAAGAGQPVTLGLSRAVAGSEAITVLLDELGSLPWVQRASLDTILQQNAQLSLVNRAPGETRLADLQKALGEEPAIDEYAAVLLEPTYLAQLQRMRILEFFRTSLREADPDYPAVASQFFRRDAQTLQAVRITTTSTTHVVGTETRIPIQISNELPFSAGVSAEVVATNSSLLVREARTPFVTIEKDSSMNVTVPVQARVSAGQTALLVTLVAQNGQVVDEAVLPVTIRSSWETIALVVIGVLVSVFFGLGIWRSVRSRRSAQGSQQHDTQAN